MKKIISAILATVMILSLAACGGNQEDKNKEDDQSYISNFITVEGVPSDADHFQLRDDRIWYISNEESQIGSFATDGSDLKTVDLTQTDSGEYTAFTPNSDGSFFVAFVDEEKGSSSLKKLGADANEQAISDMDYLINDILTDNDENLYLVGNEKTIVTDSEGKSIFELTDENLSTLYEFGDGSVYAEQYSDKGFELKPVDVAANKISKDGIKLETVPDKFFKGNDKHIFYKLSSGIMEGYNKETQDFEELFSLSTVNISEGSIRLFAGKGENSYICVTKNGDKTEIVNISKGNGENSGKTTLTLASFTLMPYVEEKIVEFNRTNPDYQIEIIDYSQYNTGDDFSAGETKLNTEIISGNTPDLIELGKTPVEIYSNKGLLEDLGPYLDNDEEFSRESIVPGAYKALCTDGKLYRIGPSFIITSLYGKESVIGDANSWNLTELSDFLNNNQVGGNPFINMPPAQILQSLAMYSMQQFVDSKAGTCDFDSPGFISLLETVKAYSDSSEEGYLEPNQTLIDNKGLLATTYLTNAISYAAIDTPLDGDLKVIGFPTDEGSGHIADFQFSFGMFSDCEHKDGAWQFLKTFLDEEYQDELVEMEVPILQSSFDKMIAAAKEKTVEDGEEVPKRQAFIGDKTIDIFAATDEQISEYKELIDSIDKSSSFDGTLMGIIEEEANALFSGNGSAKEAAKKIQSKASIYISETR